MNLIEEKKQSLIKIKKARETLSTYLENGLITDMDILELLSKGSNYGFKHKNYTHNYKQSVIRSIFNSPFVLCDQKKLSLNVKQILPIFLNCRFQMEMDELDYQLENAIISQEDYEKTKKLLEFCYYGSSKDGKNILKTGHVDNFLDNKIKTR